MTAVAERVTTYADRRRRAAELAERYDFAREPLALYGAVAEAQERAFERARSDRPALKGSSSRSRPEATVPFRSSSR